MRIVLWVLIRNIEKIITLNFTFKFVSRYKMLSIQFKSFVSFCFSFCIFFIFTSCKSQVPYKETIKSISLELTQEENTIIIKNKKSRSVSFQMRINNLFPLDSTIIYNHVKSISREDKIDADIAAWKFMINNTFHSNPYTPNVWQHSPVVFLNSIGGGYCDDQSSVLAKIWRYLGYESRVINLGGHVVSEVYNKGKWSMMDADCKTVYGDSLGHILSVDEIAHKGKAVYNYPVKLSEISSEYQEESPFLNKYIKFFTSTEDNYDNTQWHLDYAKTSPNFILPSYSQLNVVFDAKTQRLNISVRLSKFSRGKLKVPLVPYLAQGAFNFKMNNKSYSVNGNFDFPKDEFPIVIYIDKVEEDSKIEYLINPKLKIAKEENTIEIKTLGKLNVYKSYSDFNSKIPFANDAFFLSQKDNEIENINRSVLKNNIININQYIVLQLFEKYIYLDSSLSPYQKQFYIQQFKIDITRLERENKDLYKMLGESYPSSVSLLFIGSKYQKLDFILGN